MSEKVTTAERLKTIMSKRNLKQVDIIELCQPYCKKFNIRLGKNDLSQYVSGKVQPKQDKLSILGMALDVSEAWLMGYDVEIQRNEQSPPNTYVGSNLMHMRETKNMTIYEVSQEIGISVDELKLYESNKKEVPKETLLKFAKLFGVDVNYLYSVSMFDEHQTAFVSTDKREIELHKKWNKVIGKMDFNDKEYDLIVLTGTLIKELRGSEDYEQKLDMAFMFLNQLKK